MPGAALTDLFPGQATSYEIYVIRRPVLLRDGLFILPAISHMTGAIKRPPLLVGLYAPVSCFPSLFHYVELLVDGGVWTEQLPVPGVNPDHGPIGIFQQNLTANEIHHH